MRVFAANDKNFTIDTGMPNLPTDYPYPADPRYVVRVEPKLATVRVSGAVVRT